MGELPRTKRPRLKETEESLRQQPHLPPPPGEAAGGREEEDDAAAGPGPDLISRLPDDVLGDVITRVPTIDGGRTQLLSRRWRPLWRAAPLNLEATTAAAAAAILRSHRGGPVRRFSLACSDDSYHPPVVDDVLQPQPPGLDGLQELEFGYSDSAMAIAAGLPKRAPLSVRTVLRFSRTLRVLTICFRNNHRLKLRLNKVAPVAYLRLIFHHLEHLTINGVTISESAIHGVLASCHVLQSLVLQRNAGYRHLRISSPTLRSLGISNGYYHDRQDGTLEEVTVEDAPLLERFIPDGLVYGQQIRVVHAPKMKMLGYLGDRIYELKFSKWYIKQKTEAVRLPDALRTVKILALDVAPDNLEAVVDILAYFPCVEKLYMVLTRWKMMNVRAKTKNVWRNVPLECLDKHLKVLEFKSYRGNLADVSFIRFFLSKARVLESLRVLAARDKCGPKWISLQRKKLRLSARASRGAMLSFEPEPDHGTPSRVPIKHIHDLARNDPYGVSSCTCLNDNSSSFFILDD